MSTVLLNIIVTLAGILYVFSVVGVMDYFVKKKNFPQDISRKIVHIAAGSWLISWFFFDDGHWTKYLNILPALIWTVLLLIKGFTASVDDEAVKTMTRTGDRKELLRGPLFFTLVMCLMGTVFYKSPLALTAMGLLGWGDGLAPVFGKRFGKHKYKIFTEKTVEGSLAFFIFGLAGALVFNVLYYNQIHFSFIMVSALIVTLVEAVSPKDIDNILIPVTVIILYTYVF